MISCALCQGTGVTTIEVPFVALGKQILPGRYTCDGCAGRGFVEEPYERLWRALTSCRIEQRAMVADALTAAHDTLMACGKPSPEVYVVAGLLDGFPPVTEETKVLAGTAISTRRVG